MLKLRVKYQSKSGSLGLSKTTGAFLIVGLALVFIVGLAPIPKPLFPENYDTTLCSKDGELLRAAIADDEQWRFAPSDSIPKKFEIYSFIF